MDELIGNSVCLLYSGLIDFYQLNGSLILIKAIRLLSFLSLGIH